MLKDMKITMKLLLSFSIVALLVLFAGLSGYLGISKIDTNLQDIVETTPLVDAALAMKVSVGQDLQNIVEILTAKNKDELATAWENHKSSNQLFNSFAKATLDGGETNGGTIFAAKDANLRKIVEEAKDFHTKEFKARIEQIRSSKEAEYKINQDIAATMGQMEDNFSAIISLTDSLAAAIKERIVSQISSGTTVQTLGREIIWGNLALRMQDSVAISRIAIEEYAQSLDAGMLPELRKEFDNSAANFNRWSQVLLDGGTTRDDKVSKMTEATLRSMVVELQRIHNEKFSASSQKFMGLQDQLVSHLELRKKLHSEAAQISRKMETMLSGIENGAKESVNNSHHAAVTAKNRAITSLLMVNIAAIIIAIALGIFIAKLITGPILKTVEFTGILSRGDFSCHLDINQKDELGAMANNINSMVNRLSKMIGDINKGIGSLAGSSNSMNDISHSMSNSSDQTVAKANSVAIAAEEMNSNMDSVAAAMEEATSNVDTVAAATEEMSVSITDITKEASQARSQTQDAVNLAQDSTAMVNELGKAAEEISQVTETIADISNKTNLLALNATIEAARAGEAGKGFAVVANEIKELASQTAEATTDISSKLKTIQSSTTTTVQGISKISSAIDNVNDVVGNITNAMEQQNTATAEIAENISQASLGLKEINENVAETSQATSKVSLEMGEVNEAATEISNSSAMVGNTAGELCKLADNLNIQMADFKVADAGFQSGPIKLAHAAWRKKLSDLLSGEISLDPADIADHQSCAFGKWYFSDGKKKYSQIPVFNEIDAQHAKVHDTAKHIAQLVKDGNHKEAEKVFAGFHEITDKLFDQLDTLEVKAG